MEKKELLHEAYLQGVAIGACGGFTEATSIREIVENLFTPQGVEFCIKRGFPSLELFRRLGAIEDGEPLGVHIDCGDITLEDPQRAFLVGDTRARITYTATQRNGLYLMHGASAEVQASGYSVTHIEHDNSSRVQTEKSGDAVIL